MEEDIEILEEFKNNKLQRDKLEINEKGGFKIGEIYKLTELNPAISNVISRLKQLEEENEKAITSLANTATELANSIPKSKVKEFLSEIKTEYSKIDKESDEYFKQEDKTMQDYYSECTRIAMLQTLAYVRDSLEEILKEEADIK